MIIKYILRNIPNILPETTQFILYKFLLEIISVVINGAIFKCKHQYFKLILFLHNLFNFTNKLFFNYKYITYFFRKKFIFIFNNSIILHSKGFFIFFILLFTLKF